MAPWVAYVNPAELLDMLELKVPSPMVSNTLGEKFEIRASRANGLPALKLILITKVMDTFAIAIAL